jgi:hypothetical protein
MDIDRRCEQEELAAQKRDSGFALGIVWLAAVLKM